MAEERIANTEVRGHRAAKIAGQQYCAEYGRSRNRVQHRANEQKDSKGDETLTAIQVREYLNDGAGFMNLMMLSGIRKSTTNPLRMRPAQTLSSMWEQFAYPMA